MKGSPEWVVVVSDGRLAMVRRRTERGVEVAFPLGGRYQVLPSESVKPFNPKDYPVQISASRRRKMKQCGETPQDEIEKVCNQCFTLKPVTAFAANQTRKDGSTIRRPTCLDCRSGIDGVRNHETRRDGSRPVRPDCGAFWQCPICEKHGIVDVTVKLALGSRTLNRRCKGLHLRQLQYRPGEV